jgi:hypothetical protein
MMTGRFQKKHSEQRGIMAEKQVRGKCHMGAYIPNEYG